MVAETAVEARPLEQRTFSQDRFRIFLNHAYTEWLRRQLSNGAKVEDTQDANKMIKLTKHPDEHIFPQEKQQVIQDLDNETVLFLAHYLNDTVDQEQVFSRVAKARGLAFQPAIGQQELPVLKIPILEKVEKSAA